MTARVLRAVIRAALSWTLRAASRPAAALLAAALALAPGAPLHATVFPASYPEGPVWIDGTLYWAEMGADRVMAWPGDGLPRVFFQQQGCGPTALARYRADEILVLCHRDGALVRLDAAGAALATVRQDAAGNRLRDPNDASADGAGGVWFSDPGRFSATAPAEGALYHLAPDGRLTRHVTGLAYGNGVFVDRPGNRLLVSEHLARRVLAYPMIAGTLGMPWVLMDFDALGIAPPDYPEAGPDGLEIAPDGTLWVAEYGAGRLHGWRPGAGTGTGTGLDTGLVARTTLPAPFVTSIAFGPGGMAAMTGSFDNRDPFPGTVWVVPAASLGGPIATALRP